MGETKKDIKENEGKIKLLRCANSINYWREGNLFAYDASYANLMRIRDEVLQKVNPLQREEYISRFKTLKQKLEAKDKEIVSKLIKIINEVY